MELVDINCPNCGCKIHVEPEPEPQWIPCSERLPEESGTYICTCNDGANIRVSFFKYQKRMKCWDMTGARAYWQVLAWMPLPEPYKAERREE